MEERRRNMNNDIRKDIEQRMEGRKFSEDEMNRWITEDLSEEYDSIMAQRREGGKEKQMHLSMPAAVVSSSRKRHSSMRRWTAAASVAVLICMGGWYLSEERTENRAKRTEQREHITENREQSKENRAKSAVVKNEMPVLADISCEQPATVTQKTKNGAADGDRLVPIEELGEVMARLTAKTQRIEDSVEIAHIKQYIETDERMYNLQQKMTCMNCGKPDSAVITNEKGN
jgi:ABC-type nickel/cobalt efflux system permease component RcnA